MMVSAGILLYRFRDDELEVLIGHPGGPFWRNRDEGAWSIPKGIAESGEDGQIAARREFAEETGHEISAEGLVSLGSVRLASGKEVLAWTVRGDLDTTKARSNMVVLEWPRGSGRTIEFPEIDELRWVGPGTARTLLNVAQRVFVDRLQESLDHTE